MQVASSSAGRSCDSNFSYSGANNAYIRSGMRATVTQISTPNVTQGHVAAWIGVGGPKLGPGKTAEWLQAGYSAMKGWPEQIYYEVTRPFIPTQYHTIKDNLQPGEVHELAVLETKPNYWQVFLDRQPVSEQIELPSSHGRFAPQVLAETWNGGTNVCNAFAFEFSKINVARAPGGYWHTPLETYLWKDPDNMAQRLSKTAFVARSRLLASVETEPVRYHDVPPLLGDLASKLTRTELTAECIHQEEPVRVEPDAPRHLLLSKEVCQTLVGYQMSQPDGPDPDSPNGLAVSLAQIRFLRGVAQADGVAPADVDCTVLGWFKQSSRDLGATLYGADQAREAAVDTFQASAVGSPPTALWLRPGCPYAN